MADIDFELLQEPQGDAFDFNNLTFTNEQTASFGFAADRATESYFGLSAVQDNIGNLQVLIGVLEPYPANVWDTTVQVINPSNDFPSFTIESFLLEVCGPYFFFGNPSLKSTGAIYKWNGTALVPFAQFPISAATVNASPDGSMVCFSAAVAGGLEISTYSFDLASGAFVVSAQFTDAEGSQFVSVAEVAISGAIPQINNAGQIVYGSSRGLTVTDQFGAILFTFTGPIANNPFVPVVPGNASVQGPPYASNSCAPIIIPRWDANNNLTCGGAFSAQANSSADGEPNYSYLQLFVQYFDADFDLQGVDYFEAGVTETVTVANQIIPQAFAFGVTGGSPLVRFELQVDVTSTGEPITYSEQTNCIQGATTTLQNLGQQLMMYLPGIEHFIIAALSPAGGNTVLNTRIYGPMIPVPPPLVTACALGTGQAGVAYNSSISVSGGEPPYTFTEVASCEI